MKEIVLSHYAIVGDGIRGLKGSTVYSPLKVSIFPERGLAVSGVNLYILGDRVSEEELVEIHETVAPAGRIVGAMADLARLLTTTPQTKALGERVHAIMKERIECEEGELRDALEGVYNAVGEFVNDTLTEPDDEKAEGSVCNGPIADLARLLKGLPGGMSSRLQGVQDIAVAAVEKDWATVCHVMDKIMPDPDAESVASFNEMHKLIHRMSPDVYAVPTFEFGHDMIDGWAYSN